jgi:hypothetical protein
MLHASIVQMFAKCNQAKLPQIPAPIDVDRCTGHESGNRAGYEDDAAGDLLGRGKTLHQEFCLGVIGSLGAGGLLPHGRQGDARGYAVYAHARGQRVCQAYGQVDQPGFGSSIMQVMGRSSVRGHAATVTFEAAGRKSGRAACITKNAPLRLVLST